MNDIVRPGEMPTKNVPVSANTLNLITPEQEEANRIASERRASRLAAQAENKTVSHVDGMRLGRGNLRPSTIASSGSERSSGVSIAPSAPSVFKLPADQVEQQPVPRETEEINISQPGAVEGSQATEVQAPAEKKPGFFKRLLGRDRK